MFVSQGASSAEVWVWLSIIIQEVAHSSLCCKSAKPQPGVWVLRRDREINLRGSGGKSLSTFTQIQFSGTILGSQVPF